MTHVARYYVTTSQQPTESWPANAGEPLAPFLREAQIVCAIPGPPRHGLVEESERDSWVV